jgi:predicted HD phosphohydrolase
VVCCLLHDIGESLGPFNHVEFCAKYDEVCFDPDYRSEPIEAFEPMVRRVLARDWEPPH